MAPGYRAARRSGSGRGLPRRCGPSPRPRVPLRVTRVPQPTPARSARMGPPCASTTLADDQTGADPAVDRVTARVAGVPPEQGAAGPAARSGRRRPPRRTELRSRRARTRDRCCSPAASRAGFCPSRCGCGRALAAPGPRARRQAWRGCAPSRSAPCCGSTATSGDIDDDGDAEPKVYDVDRDGCADLVMSRSQGEVGTDAPLVNHNKSSGQFEAMPPERSPDRTAISGSLCRTRGRERRRGDRLSRCSGVTTALTVGPARWTTSERG